MRLHRHLFAAALLTVSIAALSQAPTEAEAELDDLQEILPEISSSPPPSSQDLAPDPPSFDLFASPSDSPPIQPDFRKLRLPKFPPFKNPFSPPPYSRPSRPLRKPSCTDANAFVMCCNGGIQWDGTGFPCYDWDSEEPWCWDHLWAPKQVVCCVFVKWWFNHAWVEKCVYPETKSSNGEMLEPEVRR